MMRARGRALAVAFAVAVLAIATAAAQPPIERWLIEPFEWEGKLEAGGSLTVRNPYGDVRARRSGRGAVGVYAVMQRHRDDPRVWRVVTTPHERGLDVGVILVTAGAADVAADWSRRRVDLTVYVPEGTPYEVHTDAGLIEAKRLASDVTARSSRGEIVVTTTGSVDARSASGRIRHGLLDAMWSGSARLATTTGDIAVTVPRGADVDLAVRTRGRVTAQGATLTPRDDQPGGPVGLLLGKGASEIRVESASGAVLVRHLAS